MNNQIKKRWVDALTSGKYKQGKFALKRTSGEFCCLGVLCDLYAKETCNKWDGSRMYGENQVLPAKVALWAGFDGFGDSSFYSPAVQYVEYSAHGKKDTCSTLGDLNDRGIKFGVIAKLIEEQL